MTWELAKASFLMRPTRVRSAESPCSCAASVETARRQRQRSLMAVSVQRNAGRRPGGKSSMAPGAPPERCPGLAAPQEIAKRTWLTRTADNKYTPRSRFWLRKRTRRGAFDVRLVVASVPALSRDLEMDSPNPGLTWGGGVDDSEMLGIVRQICIRRGCRWIVDGRRLEPVVRLPYP